MSEQLLLKSLSLLCISNLAGALFAGRWGKDPRKGVDGHHWALGNGFMSVKKCTLVGALASADVSDIESQLLGAVHQ